VQTFRLDYRHRRPELDHPIFDDLVSKVSHRQTARMLGTTRRTVERRVRRFGAHGREFHARLLAGKRLQGHFSLDEAESFERDRRLQPVTLPVLIEKRSRFLVHVESAPLPARKVSSPALQRRKQQLEKVQGRRRSGSRAAVKRCFEVLREHADAQGTLSISTDLKATYPGILKQVFGARKLEHDKTSSKEKRDRRNPLFAINHTLAMLRDGVSRLVRRTWCHAKLRERLDHHLWIYAAWRNYVRGVTNRRKRETPAMAIGVDPERWTLGGLLRWKARFALALRGQ
jgi:biotin operon repressor